MLTDDYDGRTTDACLYYQLTYEPSALVSLKRWTEKYTSLLAQKY